MTSVKPYEGWAWLTDAALAHYFRDGRSLCGRWAMELGAEKDAPYPEDAHCGRCRRATLREPQEKR